MSEAKPSDTTTTLNAGSGGDVMDESSVYQSDGVTIAKRPRVVLGDDDGNLLGGGGLPLKTADNEIAEALTQIADDIHAIRFLLESALT